MAKLKTQPKKINTAIPAAEPTREETWAVFETYIPKLNASYTRAVEAIIETGRLLNEAKVACRHGYFLSFIEAAKLEKKLHFGQSTAEMLMRIAKNRVLTNSQYLGNLPIALTTLYSLTSIPERELVGAIKQGLVNPDMKANDVAYLAYAKPDKFIKALEVVIDFAKRYRANYAELIDELNDTGRAMDLDVDYVFSWPSLPIWLGELRREWKKGVEDGGSRFDGPGTQRAREREKALSEDEPVTPPKRKSNGKEKHNGKGVRPSG